MPNYIDSEEIPLMWINLTRAKKRRTRMEWALQKGKWTSHRFNAIDSEDINQHFLPIPNPFIAGTQQLSLYRSDEADPMRVTSRAELACLASWKQLILSAAQVKSQWLGTSNGRRPWGKPRSTASVGTFVTRANRILSE